MRSPVRSPLKAVLALGLLGLAVAGCTETSTGADPTPDATASPPGSASASPPGETPGGPLASCVTGDWRSTGVSGTAQAGTASARLDGGGGVAFKVGPSGETTVDFTGMQPVAFTVAVGGTDVVGDFTYAGTVTGSIQTSGGAAATSGVWEPVGNVDWGQTRVTVDLTKPVRVRPLDNARIGDYAGDGASQTGNVVDVDPLLGTGRYECRGDSLVLSPDPDGGVLTWTLERA
jgi:hypothetical protein